MKTTILTALLLASLLVPAAPAQHRENAKLPKCNKVELLRLFIPGRLKLTGQEPEYRIPVYNDPTYILAQTTLRDDEAEALANLWRALRPPVPLVAAACHVPGFAFRFYDGETLLGESSVCWGCSNYTFLRNGHDYGQSFDTHHESAVKLLERCKALLPEPK